VELLRARGLPVAGFTTEEIREGGRRVGFRVEAVSGERAVLARAGLGSPVRVGRYGVDLEAFERVALPALRAAAPGGVAVIDEIGRMELASSAFREALLRLLGGPARVVATVHVHRHPFTDALKARPDVEVLRVTEATRGDLAERIVRRIAGEDRRRSPGRRGPDR
jgi:nucleoside-triphosphatase